MTELVRIPLGASTASGAVRQAAHFLEKLEKCR